MFENSTVNINALCTLWGWMKGEVYRKKVDTRDELLVNTLDVIACLKERQDALRRTTRHVLFPGDKVAEAWC
jgi:hypothetical protein